MRLNMLSRLVGRMLSRMPCKVIKYKYFDEVGVKCLRIACRNIYKGTVLVC